MTPQGAAYTPRVVDTSAISQGVASLPPTPAQQLGSAVGVDSARLGTAASGAGSQAAVTGSQTAAPGFFESIKGAVTPNDGIGFKQGLKDAFLPGKGPTLKEVMDANPDYSLAQAQAVQKNLAVNMGRQYLPLAAAGMGIAGLSGAFSTEQPQLPPGYEGMMDAPGQRLLEQYPERYGLSFGGVNTMSQTAPYQMYRPYGAATGGSTSDFPRKNGAINGPGTGTSDDIPAMLSDGEFVFTAKAVRNMGNGSRRKGAKKMYALMKNLEGRANG